MKKLLLSLSAIAFLALPSVKAQSIPNLDFETWTTNSLATNAMDPNTGNGSNGWWDFNMANSAFLGSSPITVFRGSANPAPKSNTYYAEIVSDSMSTASYTTLATYGFPYPKINGLMLLAYINVSFPSATIKTGIPISTRLNSFSFWYRYVPNGTDTCSCTIAMYRWNATTKKRDLIGGALWTNTTPTTSWTQQTMNVFYDSATTIPDTVFIQYSASSLYPTGNAKKFDTLDIDAANAVTGIYNVTSENAKVNVYPNPANNQINMAVTSQLQGNHIEVYDITGKLMGTYTMHNNLLTINTQLFNTGLYLYKMYDNTGVQMNVGKFSVVK